MGVSACSSTRGGGVAALVSAVCGFSTFARLLVCFHRIASGALLSGHEHPQPLRGGTWETSVPAFLVLERVLREPSKRTIRVWNW
jgi:hypothetical protein